MKLTLNITQRGDSSYFVQSLKVNGKIWKKNWLTYEDVLPEGGTMDFVLGPEPSDWSRDGELPPSPASYGDSGVAAVIRPPITTAGTAVVDIEIGAGSSAGTTKGDGESVEES